MHELRYWLDRVAQLANEAGADGQPNIALALHTLVRACRFAPSVRSSLVQLCVSLVDLCDAVKARL